MAWAALLEDELRAVVRLRVNRNRSGFSTLRWRSLALVAGAGYLAWVSGPPEDTQDRTAPVTRSTAEVRARWMALAGLGLSLWFILVILAMEIPILVLRACEGR